jgi:hypothetical protein
MNTFDADGSYRRLFKSVDLLRSPRPKAMTGTFALPPPVPMNTLGTRSQPGSKLIHLPWRVQRHFVLVKAVRCIQSQLEWSCHPANVGSASSNFGALAMADAPFIIVEALYPGLTQLDFTGPHTIFSRIPGAEVLVASQAGGR